VAILSELGFNISGISLFHHDPVYDNGDYKSDALAQDVSTYGNINNCNICNKQIYEIVNLLNKIKPDILLARHREIQIWSAKLGIPSLLIEDEQFGFGYKGLLRYAARIEETFENREYIENLAEHSSLPYTKWWLEHDAYTFLAG